MEACLLACVRACVLTPGTTTTQVSATSFQSSQLRTYVKASNPWLCHQKKHTIGERYCCCRYGHLGRGCSGHVCTLPVRKPLLRPLFCFTRCLQRRAESRLCWNLRLVRASPPVLSMWLQTVKFIAKKSKCAGFAQEEIGQSYNMLKDFGFFLEDFLKIIFLHGAIFEFP